MSETEQREIAETLFERTREEIRDKRRWTALARNYEFAKRLTDEMKQNDKLPKVRTRY